jgi:hypothetical protein
VVQAVALLHIPGEDLGSGPEEIFECEIDPSDEPNGVSGLSFPINGEPVQLQILADKFHSGELISGESTLDMPGAFLENGKGVTLPPGQIVKINTPAPDQRRRKLAIVTGTKPILAVRVTDVNGLAYPHSAAVMSDNIFGTDGDEVNLKSQLEACSMNQLIIEPGASVHNTAPGIIDVEISIDITTSGRAAVRNAVTTAVEAKLGHSLPGPYQQVSSSIPLSSSEPS